MEKPRILGLLGKDRAQVKLISFITTDLSQLPDMSDLIATNDEEKKKEIIRNSVSAIVSSRVFTTIENIKDNHIMLFGDTGYVLCKSDKIPDNFDWQFVAYESDKNIRDEGQMASDVLNDPQFNDFTKNLGVLVKSVPNPAYAATVEISKFVVNVIAKSAKQNKDDMIGMLYMSLNRVEHYPHGERKKDDVPDMTNNMLLDYSIFAYDDKAVNP